MKFLWKIWELHMMKTTDSNEQEDYGICLLRCMRLKIIVSIRAGEN